MLVGGPECSALGVPYQAGGSCSGVGLECSEVALYMCHLGIMARAAVSSDQGHSSGTAGIDRIRGTGLTEVVNEPGHLYLAPIHIIKVKEEKKLLYLLAPLTWREF